MVPIILLSCSSTVVRTYDYYKYLPSGKQGSKNNLIVETPTKVKIDMRLKTVVIKSNSDLIDTLLIKSTSNKLSRSKPKNNQSFLVYSKSKKVSGTLELRDNECLIVLKDSKWFLNYKTDLTRISINKVDNPIN